MMYLLISYHGLEQPWNMCLDPIGWPFWKRVQRCGLDVSRGIIISCLDMDTNGRYWNTFETINCRYGATRHAYQSCTNGARKDMCWTIHRWARSQVNYHKSSAAKQSSKKVVCRLSFKTWEVLYVDQICIHSSNSTLQPSGSQRLLGK